MVTIRAKRKNVEERQEFAQSNGLGLEILDLTDPGVIHEEWHEVIQVYRDALRDFTGPRYVHGPFFDMYLHSLDPEVRRVAITAYDRSLQVAEELGADHAIFHSNLLPMINEEAYINSWSDRQIEYWRSAIDRTGLEIVLENLWDPAPDLLLRVVDAVCSPRFGLCLDVGHTFNHSRMRIEEWIRTLKNRIKVVHMSDSNGTDETPLVIREGKIPWDSVSAAIVAECDGTDVGLEVEGLHDIAESLNRMKSDHLYPFHLSRVST